MADVDVLVAFLRARLDEDEQAATAATSGPWRHNPGKHWRKPGTTWFEEAVFAGPAGEAAVCIAGTGDSDDPQAMADASHIARHDPARVLAEVDAKKRILERHKECGTGVGYCDDAGGAIEADENNGQRGCPDLFALTLPYATHPRLPRGVDTLSDTPESIAHELDRLSTKYGTVADEDAPTVLRMVYADARHLAARVRDLDVRHRDRPTPTRAEIEANPDEWTVGPPKDRH